MDWRERVGGAVEANAYGVPTLRAANARFAPSVACRVAAIVLTYVLSAATEMKSAPMGFRL